MSTHQILPCHLIQIANFENFLFCPNSTYNSGKSHKISAGKTPYFISYQPKTSPGGTPPVPSGLKDSFTIIVVSDLGEFSNSLTVIMIT